MKSTSPNCLTYGEAGVRRLLLTTAIVFALGLAGLPGLAGVSMAQDYVQIIETESSPLDNRIRTVILEKDLTPRSYRIALRGHTRVTDNHAEIVARRSAESFETRYHRSMVARRAIYDMYDRLSR